MRSCLILGSGRSGTSMLAGALRDSGYITGDDYIEPRSSNPKGFFEDTEVNAINEDLLGGLESQNYATRLRRKLGLIPGRRQRWLACLPLDVDLPRPREIQERIARVVAQTPFCYKDPRFSYTLPVWRPHLPNEVGYICVFREPQRTAHSIVREVTNEEYLKSLRVSFSKALRVWTLMYSHILYRHAGNGRWLFLHYDQILDGNGLKKLEEFLDHPVSKLFPDVRLNRSPLVGNPGRRARMVYRELCNRAEYEGKKG